MPPAISHRKGATLSLAGSVRVDGVPQPLNGWQIRARVRAAKDGGFASALTVSITNAELGQYQLTAQTGTWPVGALALAVEYTRPGGQVVITNDVALQILPGF